MKVTIISQRYAKALFDLAIELEKLERIQEDMTLVREVTNENPQFRRLLASPTIPPGKKASIIKAIFQKHLDVLSFKFLQLVIRKEREIFLKEISESFNEMYKKHKNILTVKIITAVAIEESTRKEVIDLLSKTTQKTIELVAEVKNDLIGGFVLKMDNSQYDASIRKKISLLSKAFEKNLYVKEF